MSNKRKIYILLTRLYDNDSKVIGIFNSFKVFFLLQKCYLRLRICKQYVVEEIDK